MNNEIKFVSPFKRLCVTVGNLPTAYMESMSYYECLTYFMKFLENQVIPAINNNSEVVAELQEFVTNYFDNLNVQNEINNKLDDMAESGVLADIINEEIFTDLNNQVQANTENIGTLETTVNNLINKKWLFVGDSYAQGYNPDGNVTGWPYLLKAKMNLSNDECIISATGGAGFTNPSAKYENIINNMTADTNVTDIVICGGYNDLTADETAIYNGMSNTLTKIREKFVNVKNIYIGFIGGCTNDYHGDIHVRASYYAESANALGVTYLPNLQYALFDSSLFGSDKIHPNANGETSITNAIYSALNGGFTYNRFETLGIDTTESDYFGSVSFPLHLCSINNISYLCSYSRIFLIASSDFEFNHGDSIKLGKITQKGIIGSKYIYNNRFVIGTIVLESTSNPNGFYNMLGKIYIDEDGIVWLIPDQQANDNHNDYQDYEAIHQIQIPQFNITYITDSM